MHPTAVSGVACLSMGEASGNSKSARNGVFFGHNGKNLRPSVPHKVAAVADARLLDGTARLQRRHGYIGRHEFDGRYARAAKTTYDTRLVHTPHASPIGATPLVACQTHTLADNVDANGYKEY